ncbi:MAG: hypothetical protein KJ800_01455, partial [Proteobacteria bacterium]|nr:hypothetical protein [Pseudomonadota bacterium]
RRPGAPFLWIGRAEGEVPQAPSQGGSDLRRGAHRTPGRLRFLRRDGADAEEAAQNDEKVYEDDEMWTKGW